ncbi:DUF397 domain-containing protein [Kitasatospora sp. NPDC096147]|uniref:DUF397 domain-containing protein n=1 Tax=Kitasatospora sp. NPDC096147 TaxID=3364093 RepID=UPI00381FAD46
MLTNSELNRADWQSSSYSGASGGNCVQPALNLSAAHGLVPVRDSKDPQGPHLEFGTAAWAAFATWAASFEV